MRGILRGVFRSVLQRTDVAISIPQADVQQLAFSRQKYMELIPDFDWSIVALHIRDLLFAYILALPIGWDREKSERSAGLRTFPLVAVAACGYMLVGLQSLTSTDAEARVMEGIITGIGFIGGGAILKNVVQGEGFVSGTATAASLWLTGAIGISVATGRFEIALKKISTLNHVCLRPAGEISQEAAHVIHRNTRCHRKSRQARRSSSA